MQRLAILLAACFALAATTPTHATEPPEVRLGDRADLWNARACVGEVGWRAPLEACAAMVWIHVKRAGLTGRTVTAMTRAYSKAVRRPPRHRAWVPQLALQARPPVAWPPHLDEAWPSYRDRFEAVLEHVRAVLRGEVSDPCPSAGHYGGPMDSTPTAHEEDPACQIEGTRQRFFRRIPASSGNEA
jgi:hypothetical protein